MALTNQWAANIATDMTRYAIFAIGFWLVLWVALGGVLKPRKIRPETPPARQLVIEFFMSLRSVAIFATIALIPFPLERAGILTGPEWPPHGARCGSGPASS